MADLGLLSGLAQGLKEGVQGYRDTKRQMQQDLLQKQLAQGTLLKEGLVQNPETQDLQFTPEKQTLMAAGQAEATNKLADYDPNSDRTKSQRSITKEALAQYPQYKNLLPQIDTMTAAELKSGEGIIGKIVSGELAAKGQLNRAQMYVPMLGVKQDAQTSAAVDKVNNDKQLAGHVTRIQGAQRIQDQLNDVKAGKMVDTAQFLGDLNSEYVNLLTGSNSPALGKLERTEYKSGASALAGIIQQITADPTSIRSPKIIQQLETGVNSLKGSYSRAIDARADLLKKDFRHNPDATKAVQDKIQEYKSQYGSASQNQGLLNEPQQGQGLIQPNASQAGSPPPNMSFEQFQAWKKQNAK